MILADKQKNKTGLAPAKGGNKGVALVTVLLITLILSLLAVVAISTTENDVLNAGSNMNVQYNLTTADSSMNVIIYQLETTVFSSSSGAPVPSTYYYSYCNILGICSVQSSSSFVPMSSVSLEDMSSGLNFQGRAGYEYTGVYGSAPGYGIQFHFYNGTMYTIAQRNIYTKPVTVGMTFDYGPVQIGYNTQ